MVDTLGIMSAILYVSQPVGGRSAEHAVLTAIDLWRHVHGHKAKAAVAETDHSTSPFGSHLAEYLNARGVFSRSDGVSSVHTGGPYAD